jgi:hypothetical protein
MSNTEIYKNFCNSNESRNSNELKLKYKLGSSNQINVYNSETMNPLIIQTPILYCPFGISNLSNLSNELHNSQNSSQNIVANLFPSGEFYDFLIRLDKQIGGSLEINEKRLRDLIFPSNCLSKETCENEINFISNVRNYKKSFAEYNTFRMNFDYNFEEPLFDLFKLTNSKLSSQNNVIEKIEIGSDTNLNQVIFPKDRFTAIIELDHIAFYINKKSNGTNGPNGTKSTTNDKLTFYCHWKIHQMTLLPRKVPEKKFNGCMIQFENISSLSNTNSLIDEKVSNNCESTNGYLLNSNNLNDSANVNNVSGGVIPAPPPPPPPPPLPIGLLVNENVKKPDSVMELIRERKQSKDPNKILKMVNKTEFKPPSAFDIQSMLKNLKKQTVKVFKEKGRIL